MQFDDEKVLSGSEEEIADEEYEMEEDLDGEESTEELETDEGRTYRSQEEFDKAFERRFARERNRLAKQMGFKSIEEATDFANAGRAVSSAAGLSPSEVRQRLQQQFAQQDAYAVQGGGNDMRSELNEIKSMIADERTEKVRSTQEAEARKEFGKLYDDYRDDILDKADETGLSIVDASAVILRPKLKQHIKNQTSKQKEVQRKRKVESGDSKPSASVDYNVALTQAEKDVATRMGISFERYYNRKKQAGEIE